MEQETDGDFYADYFVDMLEKWSQDGRELTSEESMDLAMAVSRVNQAKKKLHSMLALGSLGTCSTSSSQSSKTETTRRIANLLIGGTLRNNSKLEQLHSGVSAPPAMLETEARFTAEELQELHASSATQLAAVMLVGGRAFQMCSHPEAFGVPAHLCAAIAADPFFKTPEEGWAQYARVLSLGTADKWELHSCTGRLCTVEGASPVVETRLRWPLKRPCLRAPDTESLGDKPLEVHVQDLDMINTTWEAWHMMSAVFRHTSFFSKSTSKQLDGKYSRLDDSEMESIMIEACSNLAVILEKRSDCKSDMDAWANWLTELS